MAAERLQKLLARAGVASRRAAETLIVEGRVRVNGRVVRELGTRADPIKDRIDVDGQRIVAEKPVYYVLHKPREVVTTLDDPEGRESIAELTRRIPERVFPVGRLDYHTSGVLLLTNDGDMAQALLHPKKRVPKTYVGKFRGKLSIPTLQVLRNGVTLDDGDRTGPAELFVTREERGNTWLQITIGEGKNRQIHRMGDAVGHRVMRLTRVAFAGITVEGLRPGAYRPVSGDELRKLKRDYLNPSQRDKAETQRKRLADARYGPDPETDLEEAPPPQRRRNPRGPRSAGSGAGENAARPRTGPKKTAPKKTAGPKKTASPKKTTGPKKTASPKKRAKHTPRRHRKRR